MGNIDKFLDDMMSDERFLSKSSIREKIYKDEPIIKRASQMKSFIPHEITEMRDLAKGSLSFGWSNSALFYKQAKFMEDYEDDYDYHGVFVRYYPTYQFMTDEQLRGYFSWRTKIRKGEIEDANLSFAYLYMYELINGVGAPTTEECWVKLRDFGLAFAQFDPTINTHLKTWLLDMAICYPVDISLLDDEPQIKAYKNYDVLYEPSKYDAERIVEALVELSSYNISVSPFYKANKELCDRVIYSVFVNLTEHYSNNCKKSFCETYFGSSHRIPYEPFSGAVFYRRLEQPDRRIVISSELQFFCFGERWWKYSLDNSPERNKNVGRLLKNIDGLLRERFNYPKKLQLKNVTKKLTGFVNKAADEWEKEKKKEEAQRIDIDFSKLSGIRANALETQEKLITEEEREDYIPEEPEQEISDNIPEPTAEEKPEEITVVPDDSPLNEDEYFVIKCLLYGGDYESYLRSRAKLPAVIIDAINEKLYDMFYDTVIFFDGDVPYILEDYEDELKEMIKEN